MEQILVACGDVAQLKKILSQLPKKTYKPIATKKGGGTAQKVANRQLALAIVHRELADDAAPELLQQLRAQSPDLPILLLTPDAPPSKGPFDNALRYPIPGPVLRNAIKKLASTESKGQDKDRWRAFYKEVKGRLKKAPKQSYYAILGVEDGAPHHRLVKAFDKLSMRYHPDRYSQYRGETWGKKLHEKVNALYKLMTEAYGVVGDRRMRKKYEDALADGELRLDPEDANPTDTGPRSIEELANTSKGRRFLQMAQTDLAKGDEASAIQNLQFALSMEPDNSAIKKRLQKLKKS